jgi:glutamate 5-kinase
MPNMGRKSYCRIIVKLGTSTLTAGTSRLSLPTIVDLVRQMAQLHEQGCDVVLVSSGAMAAGRERLAFPKLPKEIPAKQMLAAVGQPRLMALYEKLFELYGLYVAQVLITRADLNNRRRYLNSRNTLEALLTQRVIPVVNENDTVTSEEIRVGDNDNLSGLVANLIEADLLVLLTDQPGFYRADPRTDPTAEMIDEISDPTIPDELWGAASGKGSGLGTGGMLTKLQAADLARRSGATVIIAAGDENDVLIRLAAGEMIGTRFTPVASPLEGRKRYILAGSDPLGVLVVDAGAVRALRTGGSLLPVGISDIQGDFERGDTVGVTGPQGVEIARGLVNYRAGDLERIRGQQSELIESILGYAYGDEVIHRNNMVLL